MQCDRWREQGRAQDNIRQTAEDFREIRPLKQRHIDGRAQAFDRAMDYRAEQRRFVLEAVIERSLRYPGSLRDRLDGRGAVAQCEEQFGRHVDDMMGELLGVGL